MITVEVCLTGIESALAAQVGGANRIELCENLAEGGTTPSFGMMAFGAGAAAHPNSCDDSAAWG